MKTTCLFICLLFFSATKAQVTDTLPVNPVPDSISQPVADSSLYNKYGDLLNDDPVYNPKYVWWKPAVRVLATDIFNWAVARYVFKFDWAKVTPTDWKNNFKKGPEWDTDGFGINFIGHPHTGSYYYNVARSNGYFYWGSL